MLRSFKDILGSVLHAENGRIGHTDDLLFDDEKWVVRYVVVRTGGLLHRKRVLISPLGVAKAEWEKHAIHLHLTREQIEASPDVDTDKPVFRQMEARYFDYYGWPYYWTEIGIWGIDPRSPMIIPDQPAFQEALAEKDKSSSGNPHLRSCREVSGYAVDAEDSRFGHVDDFLFEEGTWVIRYLLVEAKGFFPSAPLLVAPKWVRRIDWISRSVQVDLSIKAIRESPKLKPNVPIARSYEAELHEHYDRPKYWEDRNS